MAQKILIDMIKLRAAMVKNSEQALPDALFYPSLNSNGLKTIRELATFRFTCRKCEDAPCIAVCPADALEKDTEGIDSPPGQHHGEEGTKDYGIAVEKTRLSRSI